MWSGSGHLEGRWDVASTAGGLLERWPSGGIGAASCALGKRQNAAGKLQEPPQEFVKETREIGSVPGDPLEGEERGLCASLDRAWFGRSPAGHAGWGSGPIAAKRFVLIRSPAALSGCT